MTTARIVSSHAPILLVGGGSVDNAQFDQALAICPTVVAADGGADRSLGLGRMPDAVIGDMDSLSPSGRQRIAPEQLHPIAEQDSTDFDKCLRSVAAPLILGIGFLGRRVDHTLAALSVLTRHADRPCILLGRHDVIALLPPSITLNLPVGTRLSLFPMSPVAGRSEGLRWPIEGLAFDPAGMIGTSNETTHPKVSLDVDTPGMLIILPACLLTALIDARKAAPAQWPVPATEHTNLPRS